MQISFSRNGQMIATYPEEEVPALLQSRVLFSDDLYWHEGMATWATVGSKWEGGAALAPAQATASKIKKGEFFGVGAVVQLLGLVCFFLFVPFGIILGFILLIMGSFMSRVWVCSKCRGKVDREAAVCPHCRAPFGTEG